MAKIRSLYVDDIRNLYDFEINLNSRINFLIGPNGVGKSTLLNVIGSLFNFSSATYELGDRNGLVIVHYDCKFNERSDFFNKLAPSNTNIFALKISTFEKLRDVNDFIENAGKYESIATGKSIHDFVDKEIEVITWAKKNKAGGYPTIGALLRSESVLYVLNVYGMYSEKYIPFTVASFEESQVQSNIVGAIKSMDKVEAVKKRFLKQYSKEISKGIDGNEYKVNINNMGYKDYDLTITNKENSDILKLSSGTQRIEKLKLFLKYVQLTKPTIVLVDEPETHLNYGQLTHVNELLESCAKHAEQVIVATHSPYFIQSSRVDQLRYIKFISSKPSLVELQADSSITKRERNIMLGNGEIFFAEKIILVEGYADKIFIERTTDIILSDLGLKTLGEQNVSVISVFGKHSFKPVAEFIKKRLNIPIYIIADFDYFYDDSSFSFLEAGVLKRILVEYRKLKKERKSDFNLTTKNKSDLLDYLDSTVKEGRSITNEDVRRYKKYRDSLLTSTMVTNVKSIDKIAVSKLFNKGHVWLWRNDKLDSYVNSEFKDSGKVSVNKLMELYYPKNKNDVEAYCGKSALNELIALSKTLNAWVRA